MWRLWPSFDTPPREPVGSELLASAVAVVVAVVLGNFAPPDRAMAWPLLAAAIAGLAVALAGGARVVWVCGGLALGLAACALAPPAPGPGVTLPVRFEAQVRDGWRASRHGWSTRVRLRALEQAGVALEHPGEVELTVAGSGSSEGLPSPGSRVAGSGELAARTRWPLAAPVLRVKTRLLLGAPRPGSVVDRAREAGVAALRQAAGDRPALVAAAGLASALVLGRQADLPADEVVSLRRSGLAHILSVSGLHVGVVAALVWGALNLLGVAPRTRRWFLIVALVGFAALAGGWAPVRRATWAAVAFLLARQLGRPLEPLPTVWAVVAGLLIAEPSAATQVGFQLSAGITLALVRWTGPLKDHLGALPGPLAAAVAVTAVAQLASLPLVGQYFVAVPVLGVVTNLVAVPLALPLVLAAGMALLLAPVSAPLGGLALWAVAGGQALLDRISDLGAVACVAFPPLPAALAASLAGLAVAALIRWRHAWLAALGGVAALLVWLLCPGRSPDGAELRLLRVSDGMAVLLREGGASVLVDTGASPTQAWRDLARLRVRRLDALVITHTDADHIGGALALVERHRVALLALPRVAATRPELVPLLRAAEVRRVEVRLLGAGDRITPGGVAVEVLWPPDSLAADDNNASLVLRVGLAGRLVMLPGDIEAEAETALTASGVSLQADVLQLAHHGSRTSSTPPFLRAVLPSIAVAPTGLEPRFDYPHPSVRSRVLALPSVLVEQRGGVEVVSWRRAGPLVVGTREPVLVGGR